MTDNVKSHCQADLPTKNSCLTKIKIAAISFQLWHVTKGFKKPVHAFVIARAGSASPAYHIMALVFNQSAHVRAEPSQELTPSAKTR